MTWVVLFASGLMEAVWVTALSKCNSFADIVPIIVFIAGTLLSMGGLYYALRTIPTGTAYAIWVGIGAASTVAYAMIAGTEAASAIKVLLIVGIIACVIGLKLVSEG